MDHLIQKCPSRLDCHLLDGAKYTMGSIILGKRFRELAPAARAKLRREIRLPISNNYAPHSSEVKTVRHTLV